MVRIEAEIREVVGKMEEVREETRRVPQAPPRHEDAACVCDRLDAIEARVHGAARGGTLRRHAAKGPNGSRR